VYIFFNQYAAINCTLGAKAMTHLDCGSGDEVVAAVTVYTSI